MASYGSIDYLMCSASSCSRTCDATQLPTRAGHHVLVREGSEGDVISRTRTIREYWVAFKNSPCVDPSLALPIESKHAIGTLNESQYHCTSVVQCHRIGMRTKFRTKSRMMLNDTMLSPRWRRKFGLTYGASLSSPTVPIAISRPLLMYCRRLSSTE